MTYKLYLLSEFVENNFILVCGTSTYVFMTVYGKYNVHNVKILSD